MFPISQLSVRGFFKSGFTPPDFTVSLIFLNSRKLAFLNYQVWPKWRRALGFKNKHTHTHNKTLTHLPQPIPFISSCLQSVFCLVFVCTTQATAYQIFFPFQFLFIELIIPELLFLGKNRKNIIMSFTKF